MSTACSNEELLFPYWGKVDTKSEQIGRHPLLHHCLDVGAVAKAWLSARDELVNRMAGDCQLVPDTLRALIVFFAIVHDSGKLLLRFQQQVPRALDPRLRQLPKVLGRPIRHDTLGLTTWRQIEMHRPELLPYSESTLARELMGIWAIASLCHHGKPCAYMPDHQWNAIEIPDGHDLYGAAGALFSCARSVAGLPERLPEAISESKRRTLKSSWKQWSWTVAGIIVLADWVASNTLHFTFEDRLLDAQAYFDSIAMQRSLDALEDCDLTRRQPSPKASFEQLFPKIVSPRPAQQYAQALPLTGGPELLVIEDVTGSGKTEAALTLASRLMSSGCAEGTYVALPTMATANAMYRRLADCASRLFAKTDRPPSLRLAHSSARLHDAFLASVEARPTEDDGGTTCSAWLAESGKRALLAPIGVGTIDQALLAVLPNRHQCLRLLGLNRKILVVDEVHACDEYVFKLLERLLEFHAAAGGSAILLSATLPNGQKAALIKAWYRGHAREEVPPCSEDSYPLLTQCTLHGMREIPVPSHEDGHRQLDVTLIQDEEEVIRAICEQSASGACACWIRNTVGDARSAWIRLRERIDDPGRVHLFHARVALGDRLDRESEVLRRFGPTSTSKEREGQILIATQVVEQSLDLDFDLLATDLAPIDLLIQRGGRCHRHRRSQAGNCQDSPDERPSPRMIVLCPEVTDDPKSDWLTSLLPGTAAVYQNTGHLWRSAQVIIDEKCVMTIPGRSRFLVEAVYRESRAREIPPALMAPVTQATGEDAAARCLAVSRLLRVTNGYRTSGQPFLDDVNAPTRLGEPTVTVRLARWENEQLRPWADSDRNQWELSECRINAFHLNEAIMPDARCAEAVQAHRKKYRLEKRFELLILPLMAGSCGEWRGAGKNKREEPVSISYNPYKGLEWSYE